MDRSEEFYSWDDLNMLIPDYCKGYNVGSRYSPCLKLIDDQTGELNLSIKEDEHGELVRESDATNALREAYRQGYRDGANNLKEPTPNAIDKHEMASQIAKRLTSNIWGYKFNNTVLEQAVTEILEKELVQFNL